MTNDDYPKDTEDSHSGDNGMDHFVDDLIHGRVPPDEELSQLQQALIDISSFSASESGVGGSLVVEKMSSVIAESVGEQQAAPTRSFVGRLLGAKAILAATTAVALTGTAAAAASGSLPSPIQNAFSAAVSNLGVSIPSNSSGRAALPPKDAPADRIAASQSSKDAATTSTTGVSIVALPPVSSSTEVAPVIRHVSSSPNSSSSSKCTSEISLKLGSVVVLSTSPSTTESSKSTTTTQVPSTTTTSTVQPGCTSTSTTEAPATTTTQAPAATTTEAPATTTTEAPAATTTEAPTTTTAAPTTTTAASGLSSGSVQIGRSLLPSD